jgi:hypothetical protein
LCSARRIQRVAQVSNCRRFPAWNADTKSNAQRIRQAGFGLSADVCRLRISTVSISFASVTSKVRRRSMRRSIYFAGCAQWHSNSTLPAAKYPHRSDVSNTRRVADAWTGLADRIEQAQRCNEGLRKTWDATLRDDPPQQRRDEAQNLGRTQIVSGKPMVNAETLRLFTSRMRAIASDCLDLGAAQRLRALSEELEKITKRGAVLSSDGPRPPTSRQRQQMS